MEQGVLAVVVAVQMVRPLLGILLAQEQLIKVMQAAKVVARHQTLVAVVAVLVQQAMSSMAILVVLVVLAFIRI